ncbi:MAG: type II secretion system secretin GspD [Xanthomonadales bacterium]|nr:type II secretion system secretin GspD [Xanthomonadales bacterium]
MITTVPSLPSPLRLLLALGLALAGGCAVPRLAAPEPLTSGRSTREALQEQAEASPGAAEASAREEPIIEPGTGSFIDERAASRPSPPPPADGELVLNFENESIQAVVKAILGDLLQQNYVIAPGVGGTVTFSTARPIRIEQAMPILEMLLAWNNATLVWQDGRYVVLPIAQAIPGNLAPRIGAPEAAKGYELRAVPLRYISATEMEKLLQPYIRPGAIVRTDNLRNMLVLAGTARELATYLQTVEVFDVDWLAGMSVAIFPIESVEVAKLLPELEAVFGEGANTPLAGLFRFMPIERLNAILVITTQPRYLEEAEKWIRRLDRGGTASGARLYVYDVKNVKAADLANYLNEVFGGGGGAARATPGGTVAPGLQPVEIRAINDPRGPAVQPTEVKAEPPPPTPGQGIAIGDTEDIRITAIEESNSLLIRATPSQYEAVLAAIRRLDRVPLQVHIETRIIEVALNDQLRFGVQWFFENARNQQGAPRARGGTLNQQGLTWSFVTSDWASILETLDSVSETRVISAPSVVVLNNKSANINVGRQIPVVSTFIDPIGGIGGNPGTGFQRGLVQFRDTGVILNVTPRVNPGGLVFMEIKQEDSTPEETPDPTGNVPVSRRSIETEVAVQSGQTVLLGGLIKQTEGQARAGAPGLSRIPVLGGIFGRQSRTADRQELLVMITPTVIGSVEDAEQLTDEYRRRFVGLEPLRGAPRGEADEPPASPDGEPLP